MGRFYTKPLVNLNNQNPPKLEWYNLYYGQKHAGDILASFELVYKKVIFSFYLIYIKSYISKI